MSAGGAGEPGQQSRADTGEPAAFTVPCSAVMGGPFVSFGAGARSGVGHGTRAGGGTVRSGEVDPRERWAQAVGSGSFGIFCIDGCVFLEH